MYAFSPGPLRKRQTWLLDGKQLCRPKQLLLLDLSTVTRVHFSDFPSRYGRYGLACEFIHPKGKVAIRCDDTRKGRERALCFALLMNVIMVLNKVNSRVLIEIDGGEPMARAIRYLGWGAIGFGLFLGLQDLDLNNLAYELHNNAIEVLLPLSVMTVLIIFGLWAIRQGKAIGAARPLTPPDALVWFLNYADRMSGIAVQTENCPSE